MSNPCTAAYVALIFLCAHPAVAQDHSTSAPAGLISEPDVIERAALFADRHLSNGDITNGFYVDSWNMIPGAGWISAGPGYRHWYKKDTVFVDGSAAISWRGYKTAQARFELPRLARSRLTIGSHIRWQNFPDVNFYGEGPRSLKELRSEYRLRSTNVVGYATLRPVEWAGVTAQIGWLKPDTRGTAPAGVAVTVPDQPAFAHTELSVTADTRDFPGHPTRGGLVRAAVANYADRDAGRFTFRRYETEAAHFVPMAGGRAVFAVRGWLVASDTDEGQFVPFYLQPSLGGHNTLRSYADYRFHDRHALLVNVETRIAMMTHVDPALLFDAGHVASRIEDQTIDKRSHGAGLRLHTRRRTFARVGVAHGGEGWQVLFRLTDPRNLARLSRRTAAVPFVP